MQINILVSTIDGGIERVADLLLPARPGLNYLVSHQVIDEKFRVVPQALQRSDVKVGQLEGRGLCRNRNNSMAMADGDIALLTDDDVRFREEYIENLARAFSDDPEMDVGCFKIAVPGGRETYKDYSEQPYSLNRESRHYLSTIEIAFRVDAIKSRGLSFDERFGLGSPLNSFGEEAVFIHDCIRAGLQVKYVPAYVVEHPLVSTIKSIERFATINTVFKGAYDARRYGWLALPAAFYDTARYRSSICGAGRRPLNYLRERLQGVRYILGR